MIIGIDHFVITARNLQATLNFYERVLGMQRPASTDGPTALLFGSQKINVHSAQHPFEPKAAKPMPGTADFCLLTDWPVEDVLQRLETSGVAVELGPVERTGAQGPMQSVYFRDPDDNLVEVSRYW